LQLHAEYSFKAPEYEAHRVVQALESAEMIRLTSSGADLVIVGGDLNAEPDELVYRLLKAMVPLRDPFNVLQPDVGSVSIHKIVVLDNNQL
jgi:sphingomyelin phosphodiesterase 2